MKTFIDDIEFGEWIDKQPTTRYRDVEIIEKTSDESKTSYIVDFDDNGDIDILLAPIGMTIRCPLRFAVGSKVLYELGIITLASKAKPNKPSTKVEGVYVCFHRASTELDFPKGFLKALDNFEKETLNPYSTYYFRHNGKFLCSDQANIDWGYMQFNQFSGGEYSFSALTKDIPNPYSHNKASHKSYIKPDKEIGYDLNRWLQLGFMMDDALILKHGKKGCIHEIMLFDKPPKMVMQGYQLFMDSGGKKIYEDRLKNIYTKNRKGFVTDNSRVFVLTIRKIGKVTHVTRFLKTTVSELTKGFDNYTKDYPKYSIKTVAWMLGEGVYENLATDLINHYTYGQPYNNAFIDKILLANKQAQGSPYKLLPILTTYNKTNMRLTSEEKSEIIEIGKTGQWALKCVLGGAGRTTDFIDTQMRILLDDPLDPYMLRKLSTVVESKTQGSYTKFMQALAQGNTTLTKYKRDKRTVKSLLIEGAYGIREPQVDKQ